MTVFLITYDLKAPGRDYSDLFSKIKSLGPTRHDFESVWFVESSKNSKEILEFIYPAIDKDDTILVTEVTNDHYGYADENLWPWLSSRTKP